MICIKKRHIFLIVLSVIFILITILLMTNNITWYDDAIISFIRDISDSKTLFYKIITFFCHPYFLIGIIGTSLIFPKNKKTPFLMIINLGLASFINNVLLKSIFQRERPLDMLVEQGGYSFPSGHSFVGAAFYGFLIYLVCTSKIQKKYKIILSSLLAVLILLIGISRIYLGVHYPSDVTAGLIGGFAFLIIFIEIVNISKGVIYEKKNQK